MDEQLIRKILLSYRELRKETQTILEEQSKKYGISTTQLFVLDMLKQHPYSSLYELSKRINLSASTTSEVVDKMVQAGYLVRQQSPISRRSIELSLTTYGQETLTATYSNYLAAFSILEEMNGTKLQDFYEMQQAIIGRLKQRGVDRGTE